MADSNSTCLSGGQPVKLNTDGSCNAGFYCPKNSAENPPVFCPPTLECTQFRLQNVDNICRQPQGTYEPIICPPGFYCSLGGKNLTKCPAGYFCPIGSLEPTRCGRASICPQGAEKELAMDGLITVILIDFILLILMIRPLKNWLLNLWKKFSRIIISVMLKSGLPKEKKPGVEETCDSQISFIEDEYNSNKHDLSQFVVSLKKFIGTSDVGISIGFKNISYTLTTGKTIVAPQTGHLEKGSLWAVMGASGAGKTSFFNLVMGKTRQTGGKLYVNKSLCDISRFKRLIGYVPQDDVLMAELTVRQNILHNARIRLPSSCSEEERQTLVDSLLSCLGLTHVQNNVVGNSVKSYISGGQRKRVSIGMELVTAPMAVFLDEPTSGLDSTSALSILRLLKTLSQLGMTIVCVIHQPRSEIFELIDGVHLLGRGRQLYHGKTGHVVSYFESMGFDFSNRLNVADTILDIISDHSTIFDKTGRRIDINEIADRWDSKTPNDNDIFQDKTDADSRDRLTILSQISAIRGAPWLLQFRFCLTRSIRQQWYQKKSFFLEILVGTVAGLLIGLSLHPLRTIYFQGIYKTPFELLSSAVNYTLVPQISLFCCLSISLASAAPGVKTFGEEKEVYWREASAGHSRSAYYAGKVISTLPRISISALHYTTFFQFLATPQMSFWRVYVCNLMYFYCIYGLASMMSMTVRREDGPLIALLLSLIISIFGGYGPPLRSVREWHLTWLFQLCPGIWYTEALYDQYLKPLAYLYDLKAAEEFTTITRGRFSVDILLLYSIGSVYRILAFFGLIYIDRDKQRCQHLYSGNERFLTGYTEFSHSILFLKYCYLVFVARIVIAFVIGS